jgi:hypothetical protein
VSQAADVERDLEVLAAELRKLEAEYNMYFSGRLPRPPWETRSRVESLIKHWDRRHIENLALRFRFTTIQSRYATFIDLWDRGLRAREEGRPGPFAHKRAPEPVPERKDRSGVLHVTSFTDPMKEMDKLHGLYDSLRDARIAAGDEMVPFHKFAALVKDQVRKLREAGNAEVAFRVALKDGKVNLTVKGTKGGTEK